ncbi:LIM domain and actin-binding protein 1, partial [Teleopsis dalmanni]|uniref:LIM domain and actin-binding protein 1 n=1 Tax=Teleopsis dalmanni TaxID=139649 RepID=UPI0018CE6CEE
FQKSSFTKFDALQKRNLTNNLDNENESTCHICQKPVYKMEEIKAEKFKYHKTCFRCTECNKQLKVDNYQSHEGAPFCIVHFKQLFSPKCVEDNEPTQAQKPELIIRENQPEQLPSDVVKASIKSDLGLEELQQLNLRAKFQVFENNNQQQKLTDNKKEQNNVVKSSRSISERKAQLQENNLAVSEGYVTESYKDSGSDHNSDDDDFTDLKDGYSHEQLSCNGKALSALKKNFESGSKLSKEERREERKQEIQNIRSRLFMGKQARIKEMYQQAVAESEKAILSINKKPDLDIGGNAHILKELFEKGELLNGTDLEDDEDGKTVRLNTLQSEADVFESGTSTTNRSDKWKKYQNEDTVYCPKPLKCFTPPRDCEMNTTQNPEYEDDSDDDEINEQDDNYEEHPHFRHMEDEDLKKAQVAARAKLLREKFEKWEANEIQRELNDELVDIYSEKVSDDSTIESTKTIRDRFENMNNNENQPSLKQRYQVNRFV